MSEYRDENGDDVAGLKLDLSSLEQLLTSGRVQAIGLGWSDDGNEELRLYSDADRLHPLGRLEALDGRLSIDVRF